MKKRVEPTVPSAKWKGSPWHLWLVGFFFVFIYAYGAYDYFLMLGHNESYYNSKGFGDAVVVYFTDYPIIHLVFWTANIFSGLLAPFLLLLRSRWAVQVSLISAVSILCLEGVTFTLLQTNEQVWGAAVGLAFCLCRKEVLSLNLNGKRRFSK